MNKALPFALFAAGIAAAGCASEDSKAARLKNPAPCPPVTVLTDAARAIEFDGEQRLEDVAYSAEIVGASLQCRYFGERPIEASLKVEMAFGRGPKGASEQHQVAYFVAVTRSDLEVIEKAEFIVPIEFDGDRRQATAIDEVKEIVIPRANKDVAGTNFEIVVGLSLTPQQAIFNRSGKSLKFPDVE